MPHSTKIIESVPNFSEGRRPEVIERIVTAYDSVPGTSVIHLTSDADAHRSVVTLLGSPEAVLEASFRGAKAILENIDMQRHKGVHPRQGALDVCPLVPLVNTTLDECVEWSCELASRLEAELQLPIYLYQYSATRPERRDLGYLRQGGYEGLEQKLQRPEWRPDYGPKEFQPTKGVTQLGARLPLIAWNVTLDTENERIARKIAFQIREKGWHRRDEKGVILRGDDGLPLFHPGEFKGLMATGWWLEKRRECQVTMNLLDFRESDVGAVFAAIEDHAQREGCKILETEVIGLIPEKALLNAAKTLLPSLESKRRNRRLDRICERLKLQSPEFVWQQRLLESFLPEGVEINSV